MTRTNSSSAARTSSCASGSRTSRRTGRRWSERRTSAGPSASSTTTRPSGARTRASARRSPSGSAGSTRPTHFALQIAALEGFGEGVRDAGFTAPSSWAWAAAASRRTCSTRPSGRRRTGSTLRVLDSTDPAAVAATRRRPRSAGDAVHRRHEVRHDDRAARVPGRRVGPDRAGARARQDRDDSSPASFIVAITDPGKSLEAIPHHDELREVFLNPPDIGGRYSALTYVGLVPGVADRPRPRRAARVGRGDGRTLPLRLPARQPGRRARARHGHARAGRPRQADVPRRPRDRGVRRLGRAAHRREHRQARRRHRARSTASRPAPPIATARTASSCG